MGLFSKKRRVTVGVTAVGMVDKIESPFNFFRIPTGRYVVSIDLVDILIGTPLGSLESLGK
jgi:hypothetical protein